LAWTGIGGGAGRKKPEAIKNILDVYTGRDQLGMAAKIYQGFSPDLKGISGICTYFSNCG
jgi:hypothetical protein